MAWEERHRTSSFLRTSRSESAVVVVLESRSSMMKVAASCPKKRRAPPELPLRTSPHATSVDISWISAHGTTDNISDAAPPSIHSPNSSLWVKRLPCFDKATRHFHDSRHFLGHLPQCKRTSTRGGLLVYGRVFPLRLDT